MNLTVEATYENGVLKLAEPLPLKEHERVKVTLETVTPNPTPTLEEAELAVRRSSGLLAWTGDLETLRRIAEDPEFSVWERG